MEADYNLDPRIQKQVDAGSSALDIMHGELKRLLVDAEREYMIAQDVEEESEEAIDSMERKYWEGQMEALEYVYRLTYQLSFAMPKEGTDRIYG